MSALAGRPFVKMNGLGNEIVIVDMRRQPQPIAAAAARAAASPDGGAPYDQMMALYPPRTPGTQSLVRVFNNDGSEAGACGNGMRCVASFVSAQTGTDRLAFEIDGRVLQTWKNPDGRFTVDMGEPRFAWNEIPLAEEFRDTRSIELQIGPLLENHPIFPERANITVAQVVSREHIRIRTWERGAGLTQACGSAACATAVAAARLNRTGRKVRITLPGGDLDIEWRERDNHVLMTGPVQFEYEGTFPAELFAAAEAGQGR